MDNNFYTDDLERLLKEKSDEFRMYPSKRVWHSLYNDLHPSRRWPSVTISMLLVLVLLLTGYLNTSDTDTSKRTQLVQYDISVHSNNNSTHNFKKDKSAKLYTTGIDDEETILREEANNGEEAVLATLATEPSITGIADKLSTVTDAQNTSTNEQGTNATGTESKESSMSNGFPLLLIRDKNIYNTLAVKGFGNSNHLTYNWTNFSVVENTNTNFPGNNNATTGTTAFATTAADKTRPAANGRAIAYTKSFSPANLPAAGRSNTAANTNPVITRETAKRTASNNVAKTNKPNTGNSAKAGKGNNNVNTAEPAEDDLATTGTVQAAPMAAATENHTLAAPLNATTADPATSKDQTITALSASGNKALSTEDKAWIDHFAFYNKPKRKKWKDQVKMEFYVTPGLSYRFASTVLEGQSAAPFANNNINSIASQKPGPGIEAGAGIAYAFAKNLRFKAGVQFNYTNYGVNARETNHPVTASLLMNDRYTGLTYTSTRITSLVNNNSTGQPVTLHNRTYQVSIPLGLAYKLASNKKIEWYAGASIQPSYVFGGTTYLLTADLRNYVQESSAIRRWNFNTGIETYIHYNLGSFSLQAGPQFRYQLLSTYSKQFTTSEKLYNVGLKLGIVKGF